MNNTPATDKQLAFIVKLGESRDITASTYEPAIKAVLEVIATQPDIMTKAAASKTIDLMTKLPYIQTKTTQAPDKKVGLEVGYYILNDNFFKVVRSPSTGNLYAKQYIDGTWEYTSGAVYQLKKNDAQLMTLEDAKKFGAIYGTCVVCGRTLTAEQSVEAGIGPVCSSKF